jgi:hypothetical protein
MTAYALQYALEQTSTRGSVLALLNINQANGITTRAGSFSGKCKAIDESCSGTSELRAGEEAGSCPAIMDQPQRIAGPERRPARRQRHLGLPWRGRGQPPFPAADCS